MASNAINNTWGRLSLNAMSAKKFYVWKLADFLSRNSMKMSGEELADHLNRNGFLTGEGKEYQGGRGTYKLIRETWIWLHDALGLPSEAKKVYEAYCKPDGSHPAE
jgi:hypothetical protein